jgi:acylphosphatase
MRIILILFNHTNSLQVLYNAKNLSFNAYYMTVPTCIHCYISGKVHSVWFRASTQREAQRLGLTGWVRNLSDGRVEVMASGRDIQIEVFYTWLQSGPALAKVTEVAREILPFKDYGTFEIA